MPPDAELIDVGKRPGRPVPQELISTLLVELARIGRRVVRLKGGDPYVFGRGGEEAQALLDAGIAFEVVPGITSAVAAPAAAGVPVTHRGVAAAFTVVTGHRRAGEPDVDWRSLAQVGGTVVVLMGVAQRATIAAELIAGGLDPATPVAAVRSATTLDEVVARCRLDELAATPVEAPAVIVIGAVAALRLRGCRRRRVAAAPRRAAPTRRDGSSARRTQPRRSFARTASCVADADASCAGRAEWTCRTSPQLGHRRRVHQVGERRRVASVPRVTPRAGRARRRGSRCRTGGRRGSAGRSRGGRRS